jgi:hypothetical protein
MDNKKDELNYTKFDVLTRFFLQSTVQGIYK